MKYKLTDNIIYYNDKKLFRIQAVKDFSDVKCGDFGGYVEHEYMLAQNGTCWIYPNCKVCGYVFIKHSTKVFADIANYTCINENDEYMYLKYLYLFKNAYIHNPIIYNNKLYDKIQTHAILTDDLKSKDRIEILFYDNFVNNIII